MYLDSISLIHTIPCLAEPGRIIVHGRPNRLLDEVIPYLATLPGVIAYNPFTCILTFRRQPGFMTLHVDKVYITQVKDGAEGLELLQALKDAINTVWDNRAALSPVTNLRSAPHHLDIWSLLPRTNCKKCGEFSCLAFAVGLVKGQRALDECPPLLADAMFEERRTTLKGML